MHWARDYLGRIITADQNAVTWSGLRCPCCSEAVFRKQGPERVAHFAHYSLSAGEGCEFYVPAGAGREQRSHAKFEERIAAFTEKSQRRAALCLVSSNSRTAQLQLRLPTSGEFQGTTFALSIESAFGVQTIRAADLKKPRFIPIPVACPPARCSGSTELAGVIVEVQYALEQFRFKANYFRANPVGGLLMHESSPLRLGESYWLLTQETLGSAPPWGAKVSVVSETLAWKLYHVELPTSFEFDESTGLRQYEDFFQRKIIPASEHISIAHPFPHHFDVDGTAIYGEETEEFLVARPRNALLNFAGSGTEFAAIESADWQPDVARIIGLAVGDVQITNGTNRIDVRVEECPRFRPAGVCVSDGSNCKELFSLEAGKILNAPKVAIDLVVPAARIWRMLKISNSRLAAIPSGMTHRVEVGTTSIDAENWGRFEATFAEHSEDEAEGSVAATADFPSKEILGIVLRAGKGQAAAELAQLGENTGALRNWATRHRLEWVLPHVATRSK